MRTRDPDRIRDDAIRVGIRKARRKIVRPLEFSTWAGPVGVVRALAVMAALAAAVLFPARTAATRGAW